MNQTQKKYAIERINSIRIKKENELRSKFTTPGNSITGKEEINLILAGKVRKRKDPNYSSYTPRLSDVFDFSKHNYDKKFDQAKFDKAIAPVNKKAQQIKDQLMLGDAEEALKMITDFEKL